MRWRAGEVCLLAALCALLPAAASAQPANGPRETVNQSFTTSRPGTPTGMRFSGRYHAAGDRKGEPPYMRRMTFYPPKGLHYDTNVPDRCTASDAELSLRGPAACPAGSRIGGGTTEGLFYEPVGHAFLFDHYVHHVDILNNASEQIILVQSEGWTVVRGKLHADNSLEFNPTTCFPAPPVGECADDYVKQLGSTTFMPKYTKRSRGRVRSYVTTPPRCPASGSWKSVIRFWWKDGTTDAVTTRQPCRRPARRSA
jgi:hypothetical protein